MSAAETWFDPSVLRSVRRLRLAAPRGVTGSGRADRVAAARIGSGLEFAGHRSYTPGDDPRRVDWGAYGRSERLYTREYHAEVDLHVCVLVDSSASMRCGSAEKFNLARLMAATVAHVGLAGQLQVSVAFFSGSIEVFTEPLRGVSTFRRVIDVLSAPPAPGRTTSLDTAAADAVSRSPRRSLIVAISDLLDPNGVDRALARMAHRRCAAAAIEVAERIDASADPEDDTILVDSESGVEVAFELGRNAWNLVASHRDALTQARRAAFFRAGAPYVRIVAGDSPASAVVELVRGGVLST